MSILETRPMKELTLEFVTARLTHEVTKRKEKEPQGDEAAMVTRQAKGGNTNTRHVPRVCFKCGKQGHIARNCWSGGKDVGNNAKVDDYAFVVTNEGCNSNMTKWIIDSVATQHITPHR